MRRAQRGAWHHWQTLNPQPSTLDHQPSSKGATGGWHHRILPGFSFESTLLLFKRSGRRSWRTGTRIRIRTQRREDGKGNTPHQRSAWGHPRCPCPRLSACIHGQSNEEGEEEWRVSTCRTKKKSACTSALLFVFLAQRNFFVCWRERGGGETGEQQQ
jgi:hypothetical protein